MTDLEKGREGKRKGRREREKKGGTEGGRKRRDIYTFEKRKQNIILLLFLGGVRRISDNQALLLVFLSGINPGGLGRRWLYGLPRMKPRADQ